MIIVFGRGNSGTRLYSHMLRDAGVYMGPPYKTGDLMPGNQMYAACRIMGSYVDHLGDNQWSFHRVPIAPPREAHDAIHRYLAPILNRDEPKGFKMPQAGLILPWLKFLFPQATFVYVLRDPRDTIAKSLRQFDFFDHHNNVAWAGGPSLIHHRAADWLYNRAHFVQWRSMLGDLVECRFEDMIRDPYSETLRLARRLDLRLVAPAKIRHSAVGEGANLEVPREVERQLGQAMAERW